MGPTKMKPLDGELLNLLKDALRKNFRFFMFSRVRRSVNQAARDARRVSLLNPPL